MVENWKGIAALAGWMLTSASSGGQANGMLGHCTILNHLSAPRRFVYDDRL